MSTDEAVRQRFEFHRRHPEVSLESYVRQTRLGLGVLTDSVLKIYLDLKYWILFRQARMAGDTTSETALLLEHLINLVESDKAVCPISESTFLELLKQDDIGSLQETAQLIDELSLGVSLIPYPDRVRQELCHSLYSFSGVESLVPIEHMVWTKLPYALGEHHPTNTPFEPSEELVIQKAFFDHLWGISLVSMVSTVETTKLPAQDWNGVALRLNTANARHRKELRSFPHAYRIEFEGSLSLFLPDIKQVIRDLELSGHNNIAASLPSKSQTAKFKTFAKSVSTLHIGACCHAAIRWNSGQKLNGNDLFDIHHAQAALGYCDVFLTEGPLRSTLTQKHHNLAEDFPCEVFSAPGEALEWFRGRDG